MRRYWLGGGVVLFGAGFFVWPFLDDGARSPVRLPEVNEPSIPSQSAKPRKVVAADEAAPVRAAFRAPALSRAAENALASTMAKPEVAGETSGEISAREQSTIVRKPLIDAIRLLDVSRGEKYERMRDALRDSGDSVEGWTRQATAVFASWGELLQGRGNAAFDSGSVRCYLAGCEAQVHFGTEADYEQAAQAFRSLSESGASHGGRVQTPPKRLEDGRWVAAWMMMRPDVAIE